MLEHATAPKVDGPTRQMQAGKLASLTTPQARASMGLEPCTRQARAPATRQSPAPLVLTIAAGAAGK